MNDLTIQILIFKLVINPDSFTLSELEDLSIALRERRTRVVIG